MHFLCGRCKLQVAGQDFTWIAFFVLLFHTHLTAQKKKKSPEVEISGSVLVDVNDQLCRWSYGSVDL